MVDFTERGRVGYLNFRIKTEVNESPLEFNTSFQEAVEFFNTPVFFKNFVPGDQFLLYFLGVDGKTNIGSLVLETSQENRVGLVYSTRCIYRKTAFYVAKGISSFLERNGYYCDFEDLQTYLVLNPKPAEEKGSIEVPSRSKRGYSLRSRF